MNLDVADTSRGHAFSGVGRAGFLIVAIVALINAIRRTINLILGPSLLDWLATFSATLVSSLLLGIAVLLAVVWSVNRTPHPGIRQYAAVATAVALSTFVCVVAMLAWESDGTFDLDDAQMSLRHLTFVVYSFFLRYFFLGLLIAGAWLYLRTAAAHRAAIARCELDSARMDQQAAETRLSMLEAQIEPHFLLNTLANVRRLYDSDRASGAQMLANLVKYLGVALPARREAESTLGRELDHTIAYLDIHRIRMGRRLEYEVDVPHGLYGASMPPLMLLTLVENAIKHGLAPLPGGGRIAIRAARHADRLEVGVFDTGRGFVEAFGSGTGLANIRARLSAQFGSRAYLAFRENPPHGVAATIVLPYAEQPRTQAPPEPVAA